MGKAVDKAQAGIGMGLSQTGQTAGQIGVAEIVPGLKQHDIGRIGAHRAAGYKIGIGKAAHLDPIAGAQGIGVKEKRIDLGKTDAFGLEIKRNPAPGRSGKSPAQIRHRRMPGRFCQSIAPRKTFQSEHHDVPFTYD